MFDELERQFLETLYELRDQEMEKAVQTIQEQFLPRRESTAGFGACFLQLYRKYQRFQEEGLTGSVKDAYISYLRSSVLTDQPWFRIDLYDERGRVSLLECAALWDFEILSDAFYKLMETLQEAFARQNRIPPPKLDEIKLETADILFHKISGYFPALIQGAIQGNAEVEAIFQREKIRVFFGGFMDRAEELQLEKR